MIMIMIAMDRSARKTVSEESGLRPTPDISLIALVGAKCHFRTHASQQIASRARALVRAAPLSEDPQSTALSGYGLSKPGRADLPPSGSSRAGNLMST
jgi:hypothetical protein